MITVIAFRKEMLMEYSKGKIQGAVVGRVQIVSRRKKSVPEKRIPYCQ